MTESSNTSSNEDTKNLPPLPRKLNPRDQSLFEHWQRTLSGSTLYSPAEDTPRKGYTLKDIPPPSDLPPTTLAPHPRITPEPQSKAALAEQAITAREQSQRNSCTSLVEKLFQHSPIVIFMDGHLKKIGCAPPIYCAPCTQQAHGGFNPSYGIMMCQNNIASRRRMESTLVHEMIHAFDHCRFQFDMNNLKHVACSEVLFSS